MHHAIPCYGVLSNRHISTSSQCPVCQIYSEDIAHLLFRCHRSHEIWRELGLHEILDGIAGPHCSGVEILERILCDKQHDKQCFRVVSVPEMFAIGSWFLWWQAGSDDS